MTVWPRTSKSPGRQDRPPSRTRGACPVQSYSFGRVIGTPDAPFSWIATRSRSGLGRPLGRDDLEDVAVAVAEEEPFEGRGPRGREHLGPVFLEALLEQGEL